MHRQVASLLSTSSPGRLAKLGTALGERGINITTTGGAEWKHHGPLTLVIQDDWGAAPQNDLGGFAPLGARPSIGSPPHTPLSASVDRGGP